MNKPNTIWRYSPNFSSRNVPIDSIILHGTGKRSDAEVVQCFCDSENQLSAHYFIASTGVIYQFVQDQNVAWHAGISAWKDMTSLNFNSIGIELFNPTAGNGKPYVKPQYEALYKLMSYLINTYNIPLKNVLGHSDVAPDRKTDPGCFFEWNGLYKKGLAKPLPFICNPSKEDLVKMGYRGEYENCKRAYLTKFGYKP